VASDCKVASHLVFEARKAAFPSVVHSPLAVVERGDYLSPDRRVRQPQAGRPGQSVETAASSRKDAMKAFKDQDMKERLARAAEARQKALEKFKARPSADDPAVIARAAERKAIAEAREAREKERAAIKAKEAEERAAREAAEKVEREARERREAIEKVIRDAAEAAERKAERDRRYAARKARQGK
jgi:uncharacterized protein DUF6481